MSRLFTSGPKPLGGANGATSRDEYLSCPRLRYELRDRIVAAVAAALSEGTQEWLAGLPKAIRENPVWLAKLGPKPESTEQLAERVVNAFPRWVYKPGGCAPPAWVDRSKLQSFSCACTGACMDWSFVSSGFEAMPAEWLDDLSIALAAAHEESQGVGDDVAGALAAEFERRGRVMPVPGYQAGPLSPADWLRQVQQ